MALGNNCCIAASKRNEGQGLFISSLGSNQGQEVFRLAALGSMGNLYVFPRFALVWAKFSVLMP